MFKCDVLICFSECWHSVKGQQFEYKGVKYCRLLALNLLQKGGRVIDFTGLIYLFPLMKLFWHFSWYPLINHTTISTAPGWWQLTSMALIVKMLRSLQALEASFHSQHARGELCLIAICFEMFSNKMKVTKFKMWIITVPNWLLGGLNCGLKKKLSNTFSDVSGEMMKCFTASSLNRETKILHGSG